MVAHDFNPSTWETDTDRLLQVWGQFGLHGRCRTVSATQGQSQKKKEERIEGRKQNLIDSLIKISYQTDSQTFIPLKFLKDRLPVVVKNGTVGRRDGSAGKRDCHHSEDTTLIPGPHTVEERIHTRRPLASASTPTHCIINTQNATERYTSLRVGWSQIHSCLSSDVSPGVFLGFQRNVTGPSVSRGYVFAR